MGLHRIIFYIQTMLIRSLLIASFLSFPAFAEGPNPHQNWRSADTPHFRINYLDSQRVQAERAAEHAESAYVRLTKQMTWEPKGKIELVLLDASDSANGFSVALPFNKTELRLTPPDEGDLLDNRNSLEGLITHELTHTVHTDKAHGVPESLRHIFGRLFPLFPNAIQPTWGREGIATYNESTPENGQGRLRGPNFEALMHIERERGFLSLSEINADGRALPMSKQYLYGVYFYDFLNRKYGKDAAARYIHNYSNNIVPRIQSNPVAITEKPLDELWNEFLADLAHQVDVRAMHLKKTPRADGAIVLPAHFNISSITPAKDGVLAVVNDGVVGTKLLHVSERGETRELVGLRLEAHIDMHRNGTLLIAQPDICDNYNQYYDLYLWSEDRGVKRLSECQRYRRAVWLGENIAALKHEGGVPSLDILQLHGDGVQKLRTLYVGMDGIEAIDLAAGPDGNRVALAIKKTNAWQVLEFNLAQGTSHVMFDYDAPLRGLRYSRDGQYLEFIAAHDGVYNLWRHRVGSSELNRISHTYTGITLHSGIAEDGSSILGVIAADGTELRRMPKAFVQSTLPVENSTPILTASNETQSVLLGEAQDYAAIHSIYPRSWMPLWGYSYGGLHAYGISTYGSDAMGWHNYTLNAMWETSQAEPLGNFSYNYLNRHFFSINRDLWARQWLIGNGKETTTIYDRTTSFQWVAMQPWERSERRIYLGVGAAQQSTDRVYVGSITTQPQMERIAATFLQYDSRESNWYASTNNRGTFARLLFETYQPFNNYYDGHVVRVDAQKLWPLGRTVLSAHWIESRASGNIEPFQLGGSYGLVQGKVEPELNQRNLPLRGYAGGELQLRGENVRNLSVAWQAPLIDIDRMLMSPPIGINRLSTTLFVDAGSVWDQSGSTANVYRGVGVELNAEIRLYYLPLRIPVRVGIARGLDLNSGNQSYLRVGQSF